MQRLDHPIRAVVSLLAACAVGSAAVPAVAATAPVTVASTASSTASAASVWQPPIHQTFQPDGWFRSGQGAPSTAAVSGVRLQAVTTSSGSSPSFSFAYAPSLYSLYSSSFSSPGLSVYRAVATAAQASSGQQTAVGSTPQSTPQMKGGGSSAAALPAPGTSSNGSRVWINWSVNPATADSSAVSSGGGAASGGSRASGAVASASAAVVSGPANEASAAQQILRWTNQTRAQHGLSALAENGLLDKVALAKCQNMITHNYFSDNSPTYGSPLQMQQAFGVQARIMGAENIAGARTPRLAYFMLTTSAPHLANILYPSLTDIGVAVVPYGAYGVYVCQEFTGN